MLVLTFSHSLGRREAWRLNVRIKCILGWEEVLLNITADMQSVSIVIDGPT